MLASWLSEGRLHLPGRTGQAVWGFRECWSYRRASGLRVWGELAGYEGGCLVSWRPGATPAISRVAVALSVVG